MNPKPSDFNVIGKSAFPLTAALLLVFCFQASGDESFSWDNMDKLRRSIVVPSFPDRDFYVTDFGALVDGMTDCTKAFESVIDACSMAGGGRVISKGGVFKTGPIHLKSNVNLTVEEGSILSFYLPFSRVMKGLKL